MHFKTWIILFAGKNGLQLLRLKHVFYIHVHLIVMMKLLF